MNQISFARSIFNAEYLESIPAGRVEFVEKPECEPVYVGFNDGSRELSHYDVVWKFRVVPIATPAKPTEPLG